MFVCCIQAETIAPSAMALDIQCIITHGGTPALYVMRSSTMAAALPYIISCNDKYVTLYDDTWHLMCLAIISFAAGDDGFIVHGSWTVRVELPSGMKCDDEEVPL